MSVARLASTGTGAIVSCTFTSCVWLELLFLLSVYVQVRSEERRVGKEFRSGSPVITQTSKLSVAVGATGKFATHCPVTVARLASTGTGSIVSCTFTSCVWLELLFLLSVYVQVIV